MMWKSVYMILVLDDDFTGGQKEQHSEHGAGPQQQHICGEERDMFTCMSERREERRGEEERGEDTLIVQ